MESTFTKTSSSARPSSTHGPHFNVSPIRSRVLKESIAANRKAGGPRPRPPKWTKPPKYEGLQSTLNLNDGLKPLPSSKRPKRGPAPISSASSLTTNRRNQNETTISPSSGDEESRSTEPMIFDLETMLEISPHAFDLSKDPVMCELDEIASASYTEPIHSARSKLGSHEGSQTLEMAPFTQSTSHPETAQEDGCEEPQNRNIPSR